MFLGRGASLSALGLISRLIGAEPARAAPVLFADSFQRLSTSKGWGKPWLNQRYGLLWGISKSKGFYDVPAPQKGADDYCPNPVVVLNRDVADVDLTATMSTFNPNGRFGLVARMVGYARCYTATVQGGHLSICHFTDNAYEELGKAPFSPIAGTRYRVRFKVAGINPVSLKAKIWKAGRTQPSRWSVSVTHSDLQKVIDRPGSFGFMFMHDYIGRKRARIKVSHFKAISAQMKVFSPPRITFAYAGRLQSKSGAYRARVVAKSAIPATIEFRMSTSPTLRNPTSVAASETFSKFGVAKAWLEGLPADTMIYWRAVATTRVGATARGPVQSFHTPPPAGGAASFAFGSCTQFLGLYQSFGKAAALGPLFFAHLGDLGYAQHSSAAALSLRRDTFQDRWARMLGSRSMSHLHKKAAWISIQDDHDYGTNNCWSQTVRPFTVDAFNQMSGNGNARSFSIRYGDLESFFIDCRVHSDDPNSPDGPDHTLLGASQKSWLKNAMQASDANLLVVFSSIPFSGKDGNKAPFASERSELLDSFMSLQGPNRKVIICSGGSHAQYINRHRNPGGGMDIYEFVSSWTDLRDQSTPVQQLQPAGPIDPQRAVRAEPGLGLVSLDAAGANRKVRMRCVSSRTGLDVWPPLIIDV